MHLVIKLSSEYSCQSVNTWDTTRWWGCSVWTHLDTCCVSAFLHINSGSVSFLVYLLWVPVIHYCQMKGMVMTSSIKVWLLNSSVLICCVFYSSVKHFGCQMQTWCLSDIMGSDFKNSICIQSSTYIYYDGVGYHLYILMIIHQK